MGYPARALILVALITVGGGTMALGKTLTIASAMRGQLVDGTGAPAAGVTVQRQWSYSDNSGSDTVTTDADGRFAFDVVEKKSFWAGLIAHNPVIDQQFTHDGNGAAQLFLHVFKRDYAPNGERDGAPLNVVCRTDTDAAPGPDGLFLSTCRLVE